MMDPDHYQEALEEIGTLTELLREVRDKGLIYWEPQTSRGEIQKADMIERINKRVDPPKAAVENDEPEDTPAPPGP